MGLFDNNNGSFFGSDNNTDNAPSPPPSSTPSNPFDGSGNPFGGLGGKFDLSGVDISGGWKQEAKALGKALAQMALIGLAAYGHIFDFPNHRRDYWGCCLGEDLGHCLYYYQIQKMNHYC